MTSTILINPDVVGGVIILAAIGCAVLLPDLLKVQRSLKLYPAPSLIQRILGQFGLAAVKQALADLLPWQRAIRPNVLKLRGGNYMAAWRLAGADVGTLSDEDVLNTAYSVSATIGAQLPSTKIQFYVRPALFREYERGLGWKHPISRLIDDLRAEFFLERERVYHTERTITLTWQPPPEWVEKMTAAISVGVDAQLRTENDLLAQFEGMCEAFEAALNNGRTLVATRLGTRKVRDVTGTERTVSDVISFANTCLTGVKVALVAPPPDVPIHDYLAVEVRGGYEPRIGELECSAIVPTTFPPEAVPLMLEKLTTMKVSCMLHVSFVPETVAAATSTLSRGASNFKAAANFSAKRHVDPGYMDAHEQMVEAIGKTTDDYTRYGLASFTILVWARDRRLVRKAERAIEAVLNDCHFRGKVRRNGALDTVLSTLPGQTEIRKKREFQLDALTIAKVVPIHEASLGRKYSEAESFKGIRVPPTTYALGPGGQLFRKHLNVADVFHSVKFGRPTVGKSVDEAYESAMWLTRLPWGGVTSIDRGPSGYQICKMFDGQYYRILDSSSPGFAIFSDAHIPAQAREIYHIIKRMVELSGVPVNGDREKWIKDAIKVIGGRPRAERSMFAFWEQLQDHDDSLRKVLKKYTRLGDMGATFDSTVDTFEVGRFNVIDLELAMNLSPELLIPLLECVIWKTRTSVRRMKQAMGAEGDLVHWRFAVDEVNHSLMRHPIGVQYLVDMSLMGRKENFALSLASNSMLKFSECEGSSDIIDAAASRVYFNDPAAVGKNRKLYEGHELPERGILWVPDLADREFVLHQPGANVCRRLTHRLDKNMMAIVGTSRNVRVVDEFIDRFPVAKWGEHHWKGQMLRAQGAEEAADRLAAILEAADEAAETKQLVAS
jgi:type IV secretory pathway VirB4 component